MQEIESIIKQRELAKYLQILPGLIHNLNSPLMNISGRVELLKYKHPEITVTDDILKQIGRINHIIACLQYIIQTEQATVKKTISLKIFLESLSAFILSGTDYSRFLEITLQAEDNLYVEVIPSYLLNAVYECITHGLKQRKDKQTVAIRAASEDKKVFIEICSPEIGFTESEMFILNSGELFDFHNQAVLDVMTAKYLISESDGSFHIRENQSETFYRFEFTAKPPTLPNQP